MAGLFATEPVITESLWQRRLWSALFAGVALMLTGAGVFIPARRVAKTDPIIALRRQ